MIALKEKKISFPWEKKENFELCFPKLRKTNAGAHAKSEILTFEIKKAKS